MAEEFNQRRRRVVGAAAFVIAGSRICMFKRAQAQPVRATEVDFPSLGGAATWINSQPLTPKALRGRVVLINFCNYSCINWLRAVPYIRAWDEKYRDDGLVVIGVHSPEFDFEKDLSNVRRALSNMRIRYPIAMDNDHAVWRAFNNEYWPALYFIDAQGHIRHHKFGEGDYVQSEKMIQRLVADSGITDVSRELVTVDGQGVEAAADWSNLKTPETYIGYARTENFASPGGSVRDVRRVYDAPARLSLNQWALSGEWIMGPQATVSSEANGRIACRFHARDLHIVMGSGARATPVQFRVLIDGKPPGKSHGLDVDPTGRGAVTVPRLYQLVRQTPPIVDRQFEVEFLNPGVEAFAFTFG